MRLLKKACLLALTIPAFFSHGARELLGLAAHADDAAESIAVSLDYFRSPSFERLPWEQQLKIRQVFDQLARVYTQEELETFLYELKDGDVVIVGSKSDAVVRIASSEAPSCARTTDLRQE